MRNKSVATRRRRPAARLALHVAAGLGAAALINAVRVRAAHAKYPPPGKFVTMGTDRVHYIDHGPGEPGAPPIVLIHGNFSMVQDFELSAVVERLKARHRVIVFDRPGFGYTPRRRDTVWTPQRQAALLVEAARQLGVERPVVVGHSWATLVALAWALDHPDRIGGLVLASGYYFPTPRPDVLLQKPLALPVIGDIFSWTLAPIQVRLTKPLANRLIFGPTPTSDFFDSHFPWELAARPSQVRATIADTAQMIEAAASLAPRYAELSLPVTLVHGTADRLVGFEGHAQRLADALPHVRLVAIEGAGHMVQHIAPDIVTEAIEAVASSLAPSALGWSTAA